MARGCPELCRAAAHEMTSLLLSLHSERALVRAMRGCIAQHARHGDDSGMHGWLPARQIAESWMAMCVLIITKYIICAGNEFCATLFLLRSVPGLSRFCC